MALPEYISPSKTGKRLTLTGGSFDEGSWEGDEYIYLVPTNLPALGIQSPCQRMIGVYNHLMSIVFRFHYHSQKVIGSLGLINNQPFM